jgi:Flp pilus assembly protein TadB
MSAGAIVAIAVGAVLLVILIALIAGMARRRRLNARRVEAGQLHEQAEAHAARAERRRVEYEREAELAREHHDRARELDPDAGDSGEEEAYAADEEVRTGRGR